jgi:tetratricopeptide (TPR) repeat protein
MRYAEAIADFNRAVRLKPDDAELYNMRGFTWYKKGDAVSALADYNRALALNPRLVEAYFNRCVVKLGRDDITINRHPNQKTPPLSHDECLGAVYLGLLPYDAIKGNHFVYYGRGQRLGSDFFARLVAALAQAMLPKIKVKGWRITVKKPNWSDRNDWWERNLTAVKYFAVRLTPDKTYVIKRFNNRSFHTEEEKLYAFARDCIMKSKKNDKQTWSTKNLWWLMLIMNGDHRRARKLRPWVYFERYFGADHDFTIAIKRKYDVS